MCVTSRMRNPSLEAGQQTSTCDKPWSILIFLQGSEVISDLPSKEMYEISFVYRIWTCKGR